MGALGLMPASVNNLESFSTGSRSLVFGLYAFRNGRLRLFGMRPDFSPSRGSCSVPSNRPLLLASRTCIVLVWMFARIWSNVRIKSGLNFAANVLRWRGSVPDASPPIFSHAGSPPSRTDTCSCP